MTLAHARKLLEETFGVAPEALIEQPVMAALPRTRFTQGAALRVKFVGLAPDERGDWTAVVRPGDVVDLYLVHPSQLSRVQE